MNILIAGGTGFIGRSLISKLLKENHNIFILTRNKTKAESMFYKKSINIIEWSELNKNEQLTTNNEQLHYVLNLSGESLGEGRWTEKRKQIILDSRINSTRTLVNAIKNEIIKSKVLINASAMGYYGPNENDILTENSPAGKDFLADICRQWEAEAMEADKHGVRVVFIRTGIVLGTEGALKRMLLPFRLFVGGSLGNGKQWMSWIHIDDLVDIYLKAISDNNLYHAVNATSPNAVTMKDFAKTLGKVLHRPSFFTVPAFLLKIVLGEMSDMVLKGQRVYPQKLIDLGYKFSFPTLSPALKNILRR